MISRLLRLWLGLPEARARIAADRVSVALPDGVRLATSILEPVSLPSRSCPTLLIRTPDGTRGAHSALPIFAGLLAESGYRVVLQDVRGRHESEGRFVPFENEARDGAETLRWIAEQRWFDGRLGLVGVSYAGYAAWAALSRSPVPVGALAVGLSTRDPYRAFHRGGAFALATALQWGLGVGERRRVPRRHLDLERGLAHRPVAEADRVALRRCDWFQDWIAHPTRDEFWEALCPAFEAPPPPSLLLAGWYDVSCEGQLRDYAALRAAGGGDSARETRLRIGPWRHDALTPSEGSSRRVGFPAVAMREVLAFLDRALSGEGTASAAPPVRFFVQGEGGWRSDRDWPLPGAESRTLYLRSATPTDGGRLTPEPGEVGEVTRCFTYDPADPTPAPGGPHLGAGRAAEQRAVEARSDVLCYSTPALTSPLLLGGPVRLVLHAASSAPDTDFAARLVDVDPAGVPRLRCEGIVRCRWRGGDGRESWLEPDRPEELEIDLGSTSCVFETGHRLRLEIRSALFPSYDRSGNTRTPPALSTSEDARAARQVVLHDADHPSRLVVPVIA